MLVILIFYVTQAPSICNLLYLLHLATFIFKRVSLATLIIQDPCFFIPNDFLSTLNLNFRIFVPTF